MIIDLIPLLRVARDPALGSRNTRAYSRFEIRDRKIGVGFSGSVFTISIFQTDIREGARRPGIAPP
jgi:hypothetical protein